MQEQVGRRQQQRRGEEKDSRRDVAGHHQPTRLETRDAGAASRASMDADGLVDALDARAKLGQRELRVVASAHGLDHRRHPVSIEASEQNRRLHLGAGDRQGVFDRLEWAATNFQRSELVIAGADGGAHAGERLDDAAHWPAPQRIVAGDHGLERLAR